MRGKSQRQTRSTFQQIKAMFWRSPGDESTTKSGKEPRPAKNHDQRPQQSHKGKPSPTRNPQKSNQSCDDDQPWMIKWRLTTPCQNPVRDIVNTPLAGQSTTISPTPADHSTYSERTCSTCNSENAAQDILLFG